MLATTQAIQASVSTWMSKTNAIAMCSEYGKPGGSDATVGPAAYPEWPGIIDAACRGMGQQRPTLFAVTAGGLNRLNQGTGTSSAALQAAVATAVTAGDAYIRQQSWFQPQTTGTTGGTTAAPASAVDLPGPGGGTPGVFGIQIQGQSNANFWYGDTGATGGHGNWYTSNVFNQVLRALTGLNDTQTGVVGGLYQPIASLVGGTGTYSLGDNSGVWLRGYDQDWSNPSSWPNNDLMSNFLTWAKTEADKIPAGRPVALIRMHTENDSRLTKTEERAVYEKVEREFVKRWRDRLGRGAALTPVFYVSVPYYSNGDMARTMSDAKRNICADASMNAYMGVGSTMDVGSREAAENGGNNYFSHWDSDGSARIARRMAVRMAKWMWANGYSARDLSSIPTLGPRFVACRRVAGAPNQLDLLIEHDGGTDITVPANTNRDIYNVSDNGTGRSITAMSRQDASTIRLALDGNLSSGGPVTVDYGVDLWPFDEAQNQHPGGTVYDNRHTLGYPVNDGELANARFNLQRLRRPVPESSAGAAPAPAPVVVTTPKPPGNQVTRLQVLHRGQSNAYYADNYGAPGALRDVLAALTVLPVDMVSRLYATDDNTIHSGTSSFFDNGTAYDNRWINPNGNYTSPPSGWPALGPMQQTLTAVQRYVSTDTSIPLLDLCLHWEYDLTVDNGNAKAAYRDGYNEITKRIRAARPKDGGKHVRFTAWCPYEGGSWPAINEIRQAWVADFADPTRWIMPACGNMIDAQKNTQYDANGDPSHWGDQSGPRIYPRIGFRMAKYAYDQGWLPSNVDLSDCPSMGPRIVSAVRSGNSVALKVQHDKGQKLTAGADGIEWHAFTCSQGENYDGHFDATGGEITGPDTIRIDFPSTPPAGGRIWYATWPNFRYRALIRDDWHASHPAKYNGVPRMDVVDFPLQRTFSGVAYTTGAATQPATVGAVQDPPAGWRQAFRDDFSQPAQWGVDALDYNIWKHRNYGYFDYEWGREVGAENHEATGSTYRGHVRKVAGTNLWGVSGVQQGSQNNDPNGYGYHPGYHQLHVRHRQRWSHANSPGIGAYVLLWPAANHWTSEIDIMEMPGRTKNTLLATMHWNGEPGPDYSADASVSIDLTQWHTFDLRRTYRQVNGATAATIQLWIDGMAVAAPAGWIDNNRLTDPMVCGFNGFPSGAGWYGGGTDGSTPDDAFLELDFMQLWTP